MLCLLAVDAFMCNVYFVFIASICFVFFNTIITFHEISTHFFNVFIFVTIETLNYSTISSKYYCVFSTIFFQESLDDNFLYFFRKFRFCKLQSRKKLFFPIVSRFVIVLFSWYSDFYKTFYFVLTVFQLFHFIFRCLYS